MTSISRINTEDAKILSKLSIASFLPAHGHSASKKDINDYVSKSFSEESLKKDLEDKNNHYYFIFYKNKIAGYSKIVLNDSSNEIASKNITYMSRLYLLEKYYGLGLGKIIFDYNLSICKKNKQAGVWLKVWVENQKGINFYTKAGFRIIGKSNFKISETHSNPNHIMYLEF